MALAPTTYYEDEIRLGGTFYAAYLGGPSMGILSGLATENVREGIQAFFTPTGDSAYIYENNNLRYNIYELRYSKTHETYNLRRIVSNANPNDKNQALSVCTNTEESSYGSTSKPAYSCVQYQNDRSTVTGRYAQNGNYPITIQTDSRQSQPVLSVTGVPTIKDIPAVDLVQAYIIQAVNTEYSGLSCSAQVIVYGQKSYLAAVEGTGAYAYTIAPNLSSSPTPRVGGWLLAEWDYRTNESPVPDYPDIPPGTNEYGITYGPWVFVRIRRFQTTPVIE